MAFLFSDTQIINESFVEDINNMLNSGEVPNIFANDERVVICEVLNFIATLTEVRACLYASITTEKVVAVATAVCSVVSITSTSIFGSRYYLSI